MKEQRERPRSSSCPGSLGTNTSEIESSKLCTTTRGRRQNRLQRAKIKQASSAGAVAFASENKRYSSTGRWALTKQAVL